MDLKYLKHLASRRAVFIHPKGFEATKLLISKLKIAPGDRILEIGCGTGGTLAEIMNEYKISLNAVEILDEMIAAAEKNLYDAGLDRSVSIHKIEAGKGYPFKDAAFNKIYSESVIGFQNASVMEFIFKEIRRLLAPGGLCVINDALWKKGVPNELVSKLIASANKDFGLAHASPSNVDLDGFLKIAQSCGLNVVEVIELDAHFQNGTGEKTELHGRTKPKRKLSITNLLNDLKYKFRMRKYSASAGQISSYLVSFKVI